MAIVAGGINLVESLVNLEYQIKRTQLILDWLLQNNVNFRKPDQSILNSIDERALREVQQKYPDAGVTKK